MHRRLSVFALALLPSAALAVPMEFTHQGRLMDASGLPLDGTHDVGFAIYDVPAGGTALWSEVQSLDFDDGYYVAPLGHDSSNALDSATFDGDTRFLGLTVDSGAELPTRISMVSVPYAIRAQDADHADVATDVSGGVVDVDEVRINGTTVIDSTGQISGASLPGGDGDTLAELTCASGEVAEFDGLDWACASNNATHTHSASEVTSGVFDIARLPVGAGSSEVAAGDHLHGLSQLTGKITDAQLPVGIEATVEGYITNGALNLDAGTTIGGQAVSTGSHTHPAGDADTLDGMDSADFAGSGHAHSNYAATGHGHSVAFSDLSGSATAAQLPVGSGASQVAAGNHGHTAYAASSHAHSAYAATGHGHAAESVNTSGSAVRVCSGSTPASGWASYSSAGLTRLVDISGCGFSSTPTIVTSMSGTTSHWTMTGMSSVYSPTANAFRIYVNGISPNTNAEAVSRQYRVHWIATGN